MTTTIGPESRGLLDRLTELLAQYKLKDQQPLEPLCEIFHEFEDCRLCLNSNAQGAVTISFALPELGEAFNKRLYNETSMFLIADAFKGIAQLVEPPQAGYQVTLAVDMRMLAWLQPAQRDLYLKALASIRLTVTAAPLRHYFQQLNHGVLQPGPAEPQCSKPGQVYFIKPNGDSVTVILPIHFVSSQDAAIGHAILQEFVEARRSPACGKAPSCSYHPGKAPPLELQGVDPSLIRPGASGFMTFTYFRYHVQDPVHTERTLWSMASFYTLINFHIKACKAMMHTRLRHKINQWLQNLDLEGGAASAPVPSAPQQQQQEQKQHAPGLQGTPSRGAGGQLGEGRGQALSQAASSVSAH